MQSVSDRSGDQGDQEKNDHNACDQKPQKTDHSGLGLVGFGGDFLTQRAHHPPLQIDDVVPHLAP
jgi:hypothetical protein